MEQDEWLDLVDENDVVVGKKLRSEVYRERLRNFRVVNVFVVNSKGQLWIPRRSPDKRLFPSGLDVSAGGHVESGESYDDAFRREVREELNIDVENATFRVLGHLSPPDGVYEFQTVYEITSDEVPDYNPADFSQYFWFTPDELLEQLSKEERTKDDLPVLVRKFYKNAA